VAELSRDLVVDADPVTAAAARLGAALRAADGPAGPRLAVPGGTALRALGPARIALGAAAWGRVRLTWVDERCVPLADPESNRGGAYRAGILAVDAPPGLELPLLLDGEAPAAACARVTTRLAADFGAALDVLLLGLGADGHVASLFPGHPVVGATGLVAHVTDSPKAPATRLTLTFGLLATAGRAILLATGEEKRAALRRLLDGDPALPATRLPALTIVTDLENL
jgi:6-phosphogluconolactonase